MRNFVTFSIPLLFVGVIGCSEQQPGDSEARVYQLADAYFAGLVDHNPLIPLYVDIEDARYDGLPDQSPAVVAEWHAFEDSLLVEVNAVNPAALAGSNAWITHGVMLEELRASIGQRVCRGELWNVNHLSGWQRSVQNIARRQPVGTDELRRQALERYNGIADFVDQEIENLGRGLEQGYSAPKSVVELVITQIDGILNMPVDESPLLGPATRDSSEAFTDVLTEILSGKVIPAFKRYRDYLADDYLERARGELGVSSLPNGRECYDASLRAYTSIDRPAKAVFDLGSATVDRYRTEVVAMGSELYGATDYEAIIKAVNDDRANHFSSRDEFEDFATDFVRRTGSQMAAWFDTVPDDTLVVERHPYYLDGTGVQSQYEQASGGNPAVFRINSYDWKDETRGAAERLAVHEGMPGHHLQIAIAQGLGGMHPLHDLVGYSGYSEGWARYAEALAEEMSLYEYDWTKISRRAWPARGMVVDPGLHVFGWTREQAVAFIKESGGFSDESANRLVDRIAVWPGQLTSYDSGGLEIFALRREAEDKLGENFRIGAFHDLILENGSIPLGLLRQHVEQRLEEMGA